MREWVVTRHRSALTDCSRGETRRSQCSQRTRSSLLRVMSHLPSGQAVGNMKAVICCLFSVAPLRILGYLPLHWPTSLPQGRCDPLVLLRGTRGTAAVSWGCSCMGFSFHRKPPSKHWVVALRSQINVELGSKWEVYFWARVTMYSANAPALHCVQPLCISSLLTIFASKR